MNLFKNYQQLKLSTIFLGTIFQHIIFLCTSIQHIFFLQKFENKHFFSKIIYPPPPRNQMVRPLVSSPFNMFFYEPSRTKNHIIYHVGRYDSLNTR